MFVSPISQTKGILVFYLYLNVICDKSWWGIVMYHKDDARLCLKRVEKSFHIEYVKMTK